MNDTNTTREDIVELATMRTQIDILKRTVSAEGEIIYAKTIKRIFGWDYEET